MSYFCTKEVAPGWNLGGTLYNTFVYGQGPQTFSNGVII